MAAVKTRTGTRLAVAMADEGGKSTRTISVTRIRSDASADALLAAGGALADLAADTLDRVDVSETYTLSEGE